MNRIDKQTLCTLFAMSHFQLPDVEVDEWLEDLNTWLEFFSMDDLPTPEEHFVAQASRNTAQLRTDVVAPSFTASEMKALSLRMADGFVALPKKSHRQL
jgi:Asp-tRNA(Asn)/Glu-tRNA(Gln) amidotransferase C subunit